MSILLATAARFVGVMVGVWCTVCCLRVGCPTSFFPVHPRVGSFRSIICGVGGAALGAKKSRAWYVCTVAPEPPAAHAMKGVE